MIVELQYPIVLWSYPLAAIILFFVIRRNFVKFTSIYDKEKFVKKTAADRVFFFITRALLLLLLAIAIASPFTFQEKIAEGDLSLTVLADRSASMQLFEQNLEEQIRKKIEGSIPVSVRYLGAGATSPIGDSILNNIEGDDNILVITDGNNNKGKDLGDILSLAALLNTTISSIKLQPMVDDTAITIDASPESIFGERITYYLDVQQVGNPQQYTVQFFIDGEKAFEGTGIGVKTFEFTPQKLPLEGYHRIEARLMIEDHFTENNVYYKTLRVFPKPTILFVAQDYPRLERVLERAYIYQQRFELPTDLSPYLAVVLKDIPVSELNKNVDVLSDYVREGNGLVVLGGQSSFDHGNYQNSLFETLLPIQVGVPGTKEASDVNIVLVIDISGTTSLGFSQGGPTKLSVQKAQALEIIKRLPTHYRVGVIAFDTRSYYITKTMLPLSDQPELNKTVAQLKSDPTAGTFIHEGLLKAFWLVESEIGSKNIILISDGITQFPNQAIQDAVLLKSHGIKLYTVGIGEDTNAAFMQELSQEGGGIYFEPKETEKLQVIFNKTDEDLKLNEFSLVVLNSHHFITQDLAVRAELTGFNQVVPKPTAQLLVSTQTADPILTVWRFGLGRIAALTTDTERWAGQLLNKDNSALITRTINWAVGDPNRNKDLDARLEDGHLDESIDLFVFSKKPFKDETYHVVRVGENLYRGTFTPKTSGFHELFGGVIAVNNNKEFYRIGTNPDLDNLILVTGGRAFEPTQTEELVDFVKEASRRQKTELTHYRWPFLLAAIIFLLIEIAVRRFREIRNLYK